MANYRVFKNGNKKRFVATTSLKFAVSVADDLEKNGNRAEIREEKNGKWYQVKREVKQC